MNDREKEAFTSGFSAAWDYRMGTSFEVQNPFDRDREPNLYHRWQAGFDAYQESLA